MAVSAPGGRRQLLDLLALLEPRPFDPERPPWDATLIEGLEDGRVALYLRAHHALTDGPGGLELIKAVAGPRKSLRRPRSPSRPTARLHHRPRRSRTLVPRPVSRSRTPDPATSSPPFGDRAR